VVEPDGGSPGVSVSESDADYWDAIAEMVERGVIGDTDTVLRIADHLLMDGRIKDVTRLAPWRERRVVIDDANRADVLRVIRGGE
jgi:hypothetical protein